MLCLVDLSQVPNGRRNDQEDVLRIGLVATGEPLFGFTWGFSFNH